MKKYNINDCIAQQAYGLNQVNFNTKEGKVCHSFEVKFPPQHQETQPGMEYLMYPLPIFDNPNYKASGKLEGKVAIITGGDSGIGRSIAVHFAKEKAKIVIVYFNEDYDACITQKYIENLGGSCLLIPGDLKDPNFAEQIKCQTLNTYGKIDILINNAGVQFQQKNLEDISNEQFDYTLKSNIYSMFYLTKAILPFLKEGASIINVTSITTFNGEKELIDYVTSKGAIVGFTRSLANNLAQRKIRVNAVAPGVFWTPLQPACWEACKIPTLGSNSALGRAGEVYEIAPIFVYLASDDASYTTGQVFHINGGEYNG